VVIEKVKHQLTNYRKIFLKDLTCRISKKNTHSCKTFREAEGDLTEGKSLHPNTS